MPAEVLSSLTDEQRDAATSRGPLLVLAGPGTGKTRVIASRIASLMLDRGEEPESIVAVTYTIKAAEEMRRRVAELAGAKADRVTISTFHGLGLGILRRFGDSVGLPAEPMVIDSAQRRRLLRRLIDELGLFLDARGSGRDSAADRAGRAIEALRDGGVSAESAAAFAARWGTEGAPLAPEHEVARREFADLATVFGAFERECLRRGWVTFGDLITSATRILDESSRAAAVLRAEWKHVVVDEFQDSNLAQIQLLRRLCPGDDADVCVVGDDDQSIYAFRGGDERSFDHFARAWPTHRRVTLTVNHRSARRVVSASGALIERAARRFDAGKKIGAKPGAAEGSVECLGLTDDNHDAGMIALMIRQDAATRAGASWSDYAVIAPRHADLDRVRAALELAGVPSSRRADPEQQPAVREVLRWVAHVSDPKADGPVLELLAQSPAIGGGLSAVHAIMPRRRAVPDHPRPPLREWLEANLDSLADAPAAHVAATRFVTLARAVDDRCDGVPADEALYRIIIDVNAAGAGLPAGRERAERVSALAALMRFARSRQSRLDPPGTIDQFWSYWNDLDPSDRLHGPDVDRVGNADTPDTPDGVRLLTAHAAKGLEFDTVFVTRAGAKHGQFSSPGGRENEIEFPAGLIDDAGDDRDMKTRLLDERRRLFYVACTRAERRLVVMAKQNRKPSKSMHLYEEVAGLRPRVPVTLLNEAGVVASAAAAGVSEAPTEMDAAALGISSASDARALVTRARADQRRSAAEALDAAESARDPDALDAAIARLRECAERLSVLAAASEGRAPAGGVPETHQAWLARFEAERAARGQTVQPVTPPQTLSVSSVEDFERCPRCWYVKHVFEIEEPHSESLRLGTLVHAALERLFRLVREADANGRPAPRADDSAGLEAIARDAAHATARTTGEATPRLIAMTVAMMARALRMHEPHDNILELERTIRLPYERAGRRYTIVAKVDRIDQRADGCIRVVDYKTGGSSKHEHPMPDDLQMGVYAWAVRHHLSGGGAGGNLDGALAEYWMVSRGQRGVIPFDQLDHAKVVERLDAFLDGVTSGRYPRKPGRDHVCDLLGPEGEDASDEE